MTTFNRYKQLWERERRSKAAGVQTISTKHSVGAKDFIGELENLYRMTENDLYKRVVEELYDSGMIEENGGWRRRLNRSLTPYDKKGLAHLVEKCVRRGKSLRMSCAMLSWNLAVQSSSFEGAVGYLERCYREQRDEQADAQDVELDSSGGP